MSASNPVVSYFRKHFFTDRFDTIQVKSCNFVAKYFCYLNLQPRLYRTVVDEVVKNVRESFLNEGVDEQVLLELKQVGENYLYVNNGMESPL